MTASDSFLVPDAGPLITLAFADSLALLLKSGFTLQIVDMVLHEVTRNHTPTSKAIADFIELNKPAVIQTEVCRHHQRQLDAIGSHSFPRKKGLGELAIQEYMIRLDMQAGESSAIFLFEDHKIAKNSFHLPEHVQRVSTRAFLIFLEQKAFIESAADIERTAIQNGRHFSQIRFPP